MRAPFHSEPLVDLYHGDVLDVLGEMPESSVQAAISSPPYIGLRDYGIPPRIWGGDPACDHEWGDEITRREGSGWHRHPDSQEHGGRIGKGKTDGSAPASQGSLCECGAWRGCHGLEASPDIWVRNEIEIFRALRRVLRDDGMIMWNIGDTYGGSGGPHKADHLNPGMSQSSKRAGMDVPRLEGTEGLQLMGMPYRLMLALQADKWIVRSLNIWAKGSSFEDRSGAVMPSPVQGWRWERCRVKIETAKRTGKVHPPPSHHPGQVPHRDGSFETPHEAKWADCQGCEKCSPNDGLVLRRGSWRPTAAFEVILQIVKSGGYFSDGHSVREEGCPSTLKFNPRYKKLDETGPYRAPNARGGDDLGYVNQGAGEVRYISGFRNLRNFWRINTAPYKPGHFAVYPSKLVEPMVKMSTPEAGSCAACGAPWARVLEKPLPLGMDTRTPGQHTPASASKLSGPKMDEWLKANPTLTIGHRPTCAHGGDPVPAVILDPFSGSGTTAAVARRLGRKSIGIEINEEYLGLAVERLLETDAAEIPKAVRIGNDQMGTQEGLF